MAVTVQTAVTDNQALVPFFYLRITGFPYYICATVNPADTRYGAFAWSTPTGYPATWAQRGLQLPSEAIDQKFPDIIGGVATPGRTKLSVIDFPDPSHIGKGFFARLFAPGRAVSDSSIAHSILANDVAPEIGADSTVIIGGTTGTWTSNTDFYIGAETIGLDTFDAGSPTNLPFTSRNKYVCYGNRADGGNWWPPDPYHTVIKDAGGNIQSSPEVTAEAADTLGRTAALWMGHMRPDGNPEPETSSTCLLLGRITDLGIGKIGGMFDITIESIVADLTKGKIAPDLAHATIQDGFYLGDADWVTFYAFGGGYAGPITIATGIYATPQALANAINLQLAAVGLTYVTVQLVNNGTDTVFAFVTTISGATLYISTTPTVTTNATQDPGATSLLYALGFDQTVNQYAFFDAGSSKIAPAPRRVARVFVPCFNASQSVSLAETSAALRFFTDPGDGTSLAWVRFGDGQLVTLSATDTSANTITTGGPFGGGGSITHSDSTAPGFGKFYYCEQGDTPMVDQVVVYAQQAGFGTYTKFLGRLLASTKGHTSASDGILNVYAKGVGMGWNTLLTAADWVLGDEAGLVRFAYIDSAAKWIDLFKPYSREHGLFLVWNPSTNGISMRRIVIPQAASAGTNVTFSESNRARTDDRTSQRVDRSSIRTSWKIKPAFRFDGFTGDPAAIVINDIRARSMYPNDDRQEEIVDTTLVAGGGLGIAAIVHRITQTYATPWTLCSRSMNKRGMLLAPGTIHKVIDNTLINPFTGASGIVTGDDVYCFLTRVSVTPADGAVTIEFVINSTDDQSLYRKWSPTALVDFSLNSGGYTNGYNSGTKTLSIASHYGTSTTDATDFEAGDTVRIINRDSSISSASQTDTVVSVGTSTIVLTTGISALSVVSETIVLLQKYNSATTSRKTGATKVAWQGDGDARVIQGSTTARLNRWA